MRPAPRHRSFSLLALAATTTLLLGSCGLLEEETAGGSTRTSGDARTVTVAELEPLLPSLAEIDDLAEGYALDAPDEEQDDEPSDEDATMEAAAAAHCPVLLDEQFFDVDEDDASKTERTFVAGEDGKTIEVELDAEPKATSSEELDEMAAAFMSCEPFGVDAGDGVTMDIDVGMTRDDTYGDRGAIMTINFVMSHPDLPGPLHRLHRSRFMVVGSVGVTVSAGDGFERITETDDDGVETERLAVMDGDYHLVDELSQIVGADVAALVG